MKAVLLGLIFVISVQITEAQVIEVPVISVAVGVDTIIYSPPIVSYDYVYCSLGADSCQGIFHQMTFKDGSPLKEPFRVDGKDNYPHLFFRPVTGGLYVDTMYVSYRTINPGKCLHCNDPVIKTKFITLISATAHYDSTIRVRKPTSYYRFTIDPTFPSRYSSLTDSTFLTIFNNFPDSVTVEECIISIDTSAHLSITVFRNSVPIKNEVIRGQSFITLGLSMQSNAPIFSKYTSMNGTMHVRIRHQNTDTTLSYPLGFSFIGLPINGLSTELSEDDFFVYPNPSSRTINILCTHRNRNLSSLSIFDELGREVRRVHDGFLDAGEHEFSAELPTGMYYVRMQSGDEVLTRKVTVVR